jgi:hypothetical protein
MDAETESDLRQLARDLLAEHDEDGAWPLFRDQANARYSPEVDGPHGAYVQEAVNIFQEEGVENFAVIAGSLEEQLAEGMTIDAGTQDVEAFIPKAKHSLRTFEACEGRPATSYLEIETWSANHLDRGGRFLVLEGGKK